MKTIEQRLREVCEEVRRRRVPLADLIPLMQEAADTAEALRPGREAVMHARMYAVSEHEQPHVSVMAREIIRLAEVK